MLQICTGNKMSEIIMLKICLGLSLMLKLINIKEIKGSERKYIGESKIIRSLGTCFAVGYTAGWA
jgi:hypothetical protein